MAITLNDNVFSESNKPIDDKFGPYPLPNTPPPAGGVTAIMHARNSCLAKIAPEYRHKGLTVGLIEANGTITEYWFRSGITNADLVVKATAGGNMTQDVTSDVIAGAIGVGQTLPSGSNLQYVVETLLRKEVEPTFAQATASLTVVTTPAPAVRGNNTQVFEVGTRLTAVKLDVAYAPNDSGASGLVDLQQDDVTRFTTLSPPPFPLTVVPVTKYDGTVRTTGGVPNKTSNFGNAFPNPYAGPGQINILPTTSIVGVFPVFFGVASGIANGDGTFSTPTLSSSDVYAGSKIIYESIPSTISIPGSGFGGVASAFLWFAVPRINGSSVKTFTRWQRSASNLGTIGLNPGDLFNAKVLLTVNSTGIAAAGGTDWTNDYDVYVTSFKTGPIEQNGNPTLLS